MGGVVSHGHVRYEARNRTKLFCSNALRGEPCPRTCVRRETVPPCFKQSSIAHDLYYSVACDSIRRRGAGAGRSAAIRRTSGSVLPYPIPTLLPPSGPSDGVRGGNATH